MIKLKHTLIALTVAAVGLSGAVQARQHDTGGRMQHEQSPTRFIVTAGWQVGSARHADDRGHDHDRRARHEGSWDRWDRRQERQLARIRHAWHDGELSRGELQQLRKEQRRIAKLQRRFRADDHLSAKERRRLERAQDRASRHIRVASHNDRVRRHRDQLASSHWH